MIQTIWKIELKPREIQEISVPKGAEILCAREQHEKICVWFRCDPDAPSELRSIAIIGTGLAAPSDGRYLGTAFLKGGELVFHVFEWKQ